MHLLQIFIGVARRRCCNTLFLSSPRLYFIIVRNLDLFVYRDTLLHHANRKNYMFSNNADPEGEVGAIKSI